MTSQVSHARHHRPLPLTRRPRGPGIVLLAIALSLIVALAIFTLTAQQPPPPTIAEFAPQAIEQIKDAPSEQASDFGLGLGPGECPPGSTACGPGDTASGGGAEPIDVPRVRKCVGDPPRQIEDPQSPPCVPYWTGDNGGATYKGVTANEVRIAVPNWIDGYTNLLEAFFNKRFEFYGRKLHFIDIDGGEPGASRQEQSADAVLADETHRVFASSKYEGDGGTFYYAELARRGILSSTVQVTFSEHLMREVSPYNWQYPMAIERMFGNIGEWACNRLKGGIAEHAGPALAGSPRKFGVIHQYQYPEYRTDPVSLLQQLEACGIEPVLVVDQHYEFFSQVNSRNTMLQMRDSGATSVFCLCQITSFGDFARAASTDGYFPEWLISSYLLADYSWLLKEFVPRDQLEHAFGITFLPKQLPDDDHPSLWAAQEIDASYSSTGKQWFLAYPKVVAMDIEYRALLLLASGIQMAGPNLTPETFARGLHRAQFPNPDHPNMAGHVGFNGPDHSMTQDAAEFWWSNSGTPPYPDEGPGALCYLNGGRRYRSGLWPEGRGPFFEGPCDSGAA